DESALSRHFRIEPRAGTESGTLALLEPLDVADDAYAGRTVEGATVTYTGWTATSEDGTVTADTVQLIGLHDTEDGPSADKIVVNGMTITSDALDEDGEPSQVEASIDTLVLVDPSPALFADMVEVMTARDGGTDTAEGLVGQQQFRALQIESFAANVTGAEGSGDIAVAQVIVGNDRETERLDMVVESVAFDWSGQTPGGEDDPVELAMDGLTVLEFDTSSFEKETAMGSQMALANLFNPTSLMPYRQVDLGEMSLETRLFDLATDGFESDREETGTKTVLRSVLSPMVVTLKDLEGTPVAPYMDVLRDNGLAELTMRGSSTTEIDARADRMVVTDALFDLDEGFRTDCDYALQGVNAAAKALEESGVEPPVLSGEDPDLEAYFAQAELYQAAQAEANALIRIERLRCDLQDVPGNSLVTRGYAVAAEVTGKPVAVLKGTAKTAIAMGSMMAPSALERNLMDMVGGGLIDFIDTPGQTMTVTLAPAEPLPVTELMALQSGEKSLQEIGLTVEVKGPVASD
ncbi:MAG: hypothetical protein WBF53_08340, partial [Litorimonas sp.]